MIHEEFEDRVGGYAIEEEQIDELLATSVEPVFADEIPEIMDPRGHELAGRGFLKMENQYSQGSCQGQALTECLEFCFGVEVGKVVQSSRQFAYLVSQMHNNIRGDRGSTLSGGTKCVEHYGICREEIGPYQSRYPGHGWVKQEMYEDAKTYKLGSHTNLRSADEVRAYLGSGMGIVQIGIRWGVRPDSKGLVTRYSSSGGGHSVVFAGYLPDDAVGAKSSRGWWGLMKNSWGERWGDKGYAYVDPSAMDAMCRQTVIGRSDMITPIPKVERIVDFTKPGGSMYA